MPVKIVIDPLTRLEGHLGIEVEVDDHKVISARCKGNMFRGFEFILKGRAPQDALHITQRICGVCSASHGCASVMCLESAFGIVPPDNAKIIRNLILGADCLQSHIFHFYHLAILDYVLGPDIPPFLPRYKGDYRLSKSMNRTFMEHYLEAFKILAIAHEMRAIWGGKSPHHVTVVIGGVTEKPTVDKITAYVWRLRQIREFIDSVYLPDVMTIAKIYEDYRSIGRGYGNFLAYGMENIVGDSKKTMFRSGVYIKGEYKSLDFSRIREEVTSSWYREKRDDLKSGEFQPDVEKEGAYTWIKAPRYEGEALETGPLARMWINGDYSQGISVIDRHLARAMETKKIVDSLEEQIKSIKIGGPVYKKFEIPSFGWGAGFLEAPRGALGHWIRVRDSKITHYEVISPSTWNLSPQDSKGRLGPVEKALIGTPVVDIDNPIEVARVVRSFDPCLSCAVHLIKPNGELKKFRIV
ncbi:MAG: nickel-dependent hydrogenase large subunit [Candidatus Omnitrophica bacterium]|nr:nickel-dependent hydrogenase large subunit [Candidatus Omnitrophota bacterium]MCM8826559.1 nickel-dependent hydrogenase large subunit [Candidatus Omnitrophota bacterium]